MRVSPARLFDRRLRVPRRTMSDNRSVAPRPPAIDAQSPTLRLPASGRRCEHRELAVFHVKHGTNGVLSGGAGRRRINDPPQGQPRATGAVRRSTTCSAPKAKARGSRGVPPLLQAYLLSSAEGVDPLGAKLVSLAGPEVPMRHCGLTAGEAAHAVPAQCPHRRPDFVGLQYSAGWSEIAPHRTIGSFTEGACDGDASVDEAG
jgi:hypothetical protein